MPGCIRVTLQGSAANIPDAVVDANRSYAVGVFRVPGAPERMRLPMLKLKHQNLARYIAGKENLHNPGFVILE